MSALFIRFLNMSITAGWLILAIVVLRFLLKKAPRKMVCFLWAFVAIRLVCPFSIESPLSLLPSAQAIESTTEKISVQTGIVAIDRRANEYLGSHAIILQELQEEDLVEAETQTVPERTAFSVLKGIPYVWLAGVICLLIYAGITYISLRRKVVASFEEKKGVYVCDDIDTPFILGVIRPRIYLPSALDSEERRYVLAHEQAHIRRGDHLWKPFGYLLLAVYWFHPLIWVAYILLCKDIEIACDEKVIAGETSEYKKAYARTLLACSVPGKLITVCPLAFGEVSVKERILSVMNYKKPAFWVIIIALVGCASVCVFLMTNPVNKEKEERNQQNSPIESVQQVVVDTQESTENDESTEKDAVESGPVVEKPEAEETVDYSKEYEERQQLIKGYLLGASADRLKKIKTVIGVNDANGNGSYGQWYDGVEDDFVILDRTMEGKEEVVLYGLKGAEGMILRKGNQRIPLMMWWLSMHMNTPKIYCGDYDHDGKTEYALKTHMGTGTGVSEDELYFIETDWENGEDGMAVYSIKEFDYEVKSAALADVGYVYDAENKVLSATYKKQKLNKSINLSNYLAESEKEFNAAGFGNICSFEERNGEWIYSAEGGIWLDGLSWPQYEYGIDVSAKVTYSADAQFGLENIEIYTHDYSSLSLPEQFPDTTEILINELKADVNADGEAETIQVYGLLDNAAGVEPTIDNALSSMASYGCYVRVMKHYSDSVFGEYEAPVYASRGYHVAHLGNGIVFLSKRNGKEYLVMADPYCGQGLGSYSYQVLQCGASSDSVLNYGCAPLFVENGTYEFIMGDEENPVWEEGTMKEADAIAQYKAALAPYLEDSVLLLGFYDVPEKGTASTRKKTISAKDYFDSINLFQ